MRYPYNYWYPILESKKIRQKPVKLKRFNKDLVLFRKENGDLACLGDQCPHRGTSLALGQIVGDCIECPMHGFQFQANGACELIPANGKSCKPPRSLKAESFSVREGHHLVWLWWGEDRKQLPELPWPKELSNDDQTLSTYYGSRGSWENAPVSFYRTMEANLDIIHFPFTHRPSWMQAFLMRKLGLFKKMDLGPICDVQHCTQKEGVIDLSWSFRWEDQDLKEASPTNLLLYFPNQLVVDAPSWKTRGYFGCSPIDDHSTFWATRYYQGFLDFPILGSAVSWLFLNKYVLGPITEQDFKLQVTQRPSDKGWESDHLAAHGDQGIAEYWRLVQKNLNQQPSSQLKQKFKKSPPQTASKSQSEVIWTQI